MALSNDLLFVDTETTGLTMDHDIWEIAHARGDGVIFSHVVEHSLRNADLRALELNGYYNRSTKPQTRDPHIIPSFQGKTLVGANPAFDAYRLEKRWGVAPWHYRMIDVESMAVAIFKLEKPLGLKGLVDLLRAQMFDIPENDHTAGGDVDTTREVYKALMHTYTQYTKAGERWNRGS